MTDPSSEPDWRELAPPRYAILSIRDMARLHVGRQLFKKILQEELHHMGEAIPRDYLGKWIVSQDLGRLINLWEASVGDREGPALAHDILAIHGLINAEPRVYSKDVIRDLMSAEEAFALPVLNSEGRHLATVVHVGPDAQENEIRSLARSLIKDPTGKAATL